MSVVTQIRPWLWVGGSYDVPRLRKGFDVAFTLCFPWEGLVWSAPARREFKRAFADDPYRLPVNHVTEVVGEVVDHIRAGDSVLVRCALGRNRSTLVTGLALVAHEGLSGKAAVQELRKARGPQVLSNARFERYLLRK